MNETCEISLGDGLVAVVDLLDFDKVSSLDWRADRGAQRGTWYARTKGARHQAIWMHRLIVGLGGAVFDPRIVDHCDRNGLNNRRSNLRVCSALQNSWNARHPESQSGFIGVRKIGRRWRAQAKNEGVFFHLGYHADPVIAAKEYDRFIVNLRGEFAVTNESLGKYDILRTSAG